MRYQQLLAGMHEKPATLAIVPSLLALAMMHRLMAVPDLSSVRQFMLPASMKIDQQKKVVIKLAVDDTGQIRQLDIEQSSGLPALDKLIRKAYANAAFYPYRPYSFDQAFISRYVLTVQAQPGDASTQPQRVIPRVSTDIVQDEVEAQRIFSKQFTMGERDTALPEKAGFQHYPVKKQSGD